ncbi:Origin recognition complex subunit [Lachnellula subtilissima]|uniref:Origin recognition complex subunit 4 n=1 Tax=Lachnellula subtilissima TaxID=602034 RepID=A0A8H8RMS1_9HELO|nr:Origin recognition complex subunit [Lachnellula subtilissima]
MPASSSVPTRKRSRAQLADDDLDELSPQKVVVTTPLSGGQKKRKLDTQTSPPAVGAISSFGRTISGFLGLGGKQGKGNEQDAEEEDELATGKDIFDIEGSSAEGSEQTKSNERRSRTGSQRRSGRQESDILSPTPKSSTKKKSGAGIDIYEVMVSDEEEGAGATGSISRRGRDKMERTKTILKEKRTPGRPRKSDILKRDKALSREAARRRITEDEEAPVDEASGKVELSKRRKTIRTENNRDGVESQSEAPPSTSKRGRGRPRKAPAGIATSTKTLPKSILTPSKPRTLKSRKSVAFEREETEVDLGFKDLPDTASSKKSTGKAARTPSIDSADDAQDAEVTVSDEEPNEEEEQEEAACSICSKLNSRKGNQILFCDRCDKAVHQKCYGVPIIPEGDWFCRDCEPDAEEKSDLGPNGELAGNGPPGGLADIEGFEGHLRITQRIILDKLSGQRRIKLKGHDEQMQKVHQVVEQTVRAGEGNSMLVIGGRGCGKTTLVESIISDISTEHRENFHVVRLNGFIHTDDKIALREIWRQLGREMEVEDDLIGKSNHADTLASLLALLSHPSEISISQTNQPDQTTKSVIFILDEFDLFTTHARQTLLYNLFDIAQARKAPIAVLGLTTRIDVVESLEKRVKSRFSHRYVYLSQPRSLPAFWEICKEALTINTEELDAEVVGTDNGGQDEFLSFWHTMVDDLYNKDNSFKHHMQSHFYRTKSIPAFLASCIIPIANLSLSKFLLTGRAFTSNNLSLSPPDSKLHVLQGLSDLELALLISAARLDIILDTDTCNFAMAYDEYSSLTSKHKIQTSSTGVAALGASAKVWGRDVALGAWERLADYDLLVPAGINGGGGRDIGVGGRMWKVDVGLEEITGSVDGLSGIMAKWCREI